MFYIGELYCFVAIYVLNYWRYSCITYGYFVMLQMQGLAIKKMNVVIHNNQTVGASCWWRTRTAQHWFTSVQGSLIDYPPSCFRLQQTNAWLCRETWTDYEDLLRWGDSFICTCINHSGTLCRIYWLSEWPLHDFPYCTLVQQYMQW